MASASAGLAPCCSSTTMTLRCSSFAASEPELLRPVFCTARCSGVEPRLFGRRGSAPFSMRAPTAAELRVRTARCSGAIPLRSSAFGSAPAAIRPRSPHAGHRDPRTPRPGSHRRRSAAVPRPAGSEHARPRLVRRATRPAPVIRRGRDVQRRVAGVHLVTGSRSGSTSRDPGGSPRPESADSRARATTPTAARSPADRVLQSLERARATHHRARSPHPR